MKYSYALYTEVVVTPTRKLLMTPPDFWSSATKTGKSVATFFWFAAMEPLLSTTKRMSVFTG